MINAIIVDDEKRTARVLHQLLAELSAAIEVKAVAHSIHTAKEVILEQSPDLLFLDIKMPGGTGFDLLDQLPAIDFDIIFTTAFENYAIKAIKFSALDYLLKPIDEVELKGAIRKVLHKRSDRQQQVDLLLKSLKEGNNGVLIPKRIAFPTLKGYRFILVEQMIYCEAEEAYSKIYLTDGSTLLVSRNLKEIESLLSAHHFFRIHRSYLINMNHVVEYLKTDGGQVYLQGGAMVPVSRRRRELFIQYFHNLH